MQLSITVNTAYDSAAELSAVSSLLLTLTALPQPDRSIGTCAAGPVTGETDDIAGVTGAGDPPEKVEPVVEPVAKAKPKTRAKAAKAVEPEAEVEDAEESGPDYGAIRLEIRTRFANWAEQVGMIEGKALLDSFDVAKFSELDNSQLAGFGKKLAALEADL